MELDAAERFHKKGFKKSVPNGNCYNCGKPGHIARNCKGKEVARLTNTEEPVVVREELGSIHDNKEQLLRFNGKINGHSAWILLDSGASRNFIATDFVNQNCLTTSTMKSFTVEFADGSKCNVNQAINTLVKKKLAYADMDRKCVKRDLSSIRL